MPDPAATNNRKPVRYQGKYQPKHPEKYRGNVHNIVYRSGWEYDAFEWCDRAEEVLRWMSEEVPILYRSPVDDKKRNYYPDLCIYLKDDQILLVEIKPERETKPPAQGDKRYKSRLDIYNINIAKWKAARKYAKKNGLKFQIWTEKIMRDKGIISSS